MSTPSSLPSERIPRPQAERIVRILSQEGFTFRGALLGKRREGKTDLLRQVHGQLFEKAEGPIPFFYAFESARKEAGLAAHFLAAFCMQVRAFLMRQDDLLREPPASLDRELERAGLPLSLTEITRQFLALPPEHQLDFAFSVPAQFAAREDRPICLQLDDLDSLDITSPVVAAVDSPRLSWLVSGRYPFVVRVAGEAAWPLVTIDPFTATEIFSMARRRCEAAGVPYSTKAWEEWCDIGGSSAWLVESLITAAAIRGLSLDSLEQLTMVYIQELTSGTLGNWLSARFAKAIPDRGERSSAAEHLLRIAQAGSPAVSASALPLRLWDGLIAEEWAEEAIGGPRVLLDSIQRDWLALSTAPADKPSERARARLLFSFLLRARQGKEQPDTGRFSTVIRQTLLDLPRGGFPENFTWENEKIPLPRIFTVSNESSGSAELFWCYGFYVDGTELTESAVLLLIVICDETPTETQIEKWARQLEHEARLTATDRRTALVSPDTSRPRQQLWIAVPPGASLVSTGSERRFTWQAFFRLMAQAGSSDKNFPA